MHDCKKFMAIKDSLKSLEALVADYESEYISSEKKEDEFGDKDPGDGGQDVQKIIDNDHSDMAANPYKGVDSPVKGRDGEDEQKKRKKQMVSALLKKKMGY